ncbi:MAG: InlB B-repeat-containing protein [Bacilli bacterium]|nr:InlB B-repeat-containing protein [Bacilli bacterium]
MAKTVVKRKLNKSKLFTVLFAVLFVVSLFMSINAFAETSAFKITGATLSDKSDGVTGTITNFTDDKVINNIEFHKLNDSVTYKLVIKSNLSREITILDITDDNENSFIDYEYDKHENEKISANGTLNFDVKAIYKTLVNDITKRTQNNTVKFTIKYLDEGEKKTDTIIINPKTGDNIHISYIMLIISSIGLVTSIATSKKKKKALNMMLIGLITLPIIAKAASTLTFDLSLVSTYTLNDKIIVTLDDGTTETTKAINYGETIDSLPSPTVTGYHIDKWVNEDNTDFDITAPIYEDKTVTASWKANPYTIHFNINDASIVVEPGTTLITDGSMSDLEMVYDTTKALTSNGFTIQGYAFDSWNTKADGTGTKIEDGATVNNLAESGIVNLYARWGATPYTVNYDINTPDPNATGTTASQSKPYNTTFTLSPNGFTRTGYNFYGWNTESDGTGTHYDDEESVKNLDIDGEITLYAQWGPKSISITFDDNTDDTHVTGTMTNQTVTYDVNTYLKQNAYVRPGYTFSGWNTQSDGLGNHYDNQENITNEFVNNTTLYAEWDVNDYRIVFKKNDDRATGGMSPQTITYDTTVNLDQLGFELTGYNFVEWNTEEDGSGTSYSDQAEVTNLVTSGELELYAIWEPKQYTITYDINTDDPNATGTMSAQIIVFDIPNNLLNENQYTRTGYAFAGWNTLANGQGTHYDDKQDVTNTMSENDITLYAEWAVTPYHVVFNKNGGSGNQMPNQEIAYGEEVNLNTNTYTREGYNYLGWNTQSDGQGTHYDNEQLVKNLDIDGEVILYAEWDANQYTITYDKNGGSGNDMPDQVFTYGVSTSLNPNTYTRSKHNFIGWNTKADGTGIHYDNTQDITNLISENTTLYAEWFFRCRSFATDSWNTIISNINSDPNYYYLADSCEKEVEMDMDNDSINESYTVRLANTSKPEVCETEGYSQTACGIVIEFIDSVSNKNIYSVNNNAGGWAGSSLATWLNSDFYNKLPSDLQSVIIPTYPIVSGSGPSGDSPIITENDTNLNKIYLSSAYEIGLTHSADNKNNPLTDTRMLDFYSANNSNSGRLKGQIQWWIRTPHSNADNVWFVIVGGSTYNSNVSNNRQVTPVFRIGINN